MENILKTKGSWAWWLKSVIPATWEAEIDQGSRTTQVNSVTPSQLIKSWVWESMPVIPAVREV
jgi:hypothetical protein